MRNYFKYILMLFYGLLILEIENGCDSSENSQFIRIQWIEKLHGDYSFREKWSYQEGIYRNEFGQLSCDGICPEGIYSMMDDKGKIYTDSLKSFYRLVDTSHQFHTIQCDAWCYEWAGTDFIKSEQLSNEKIICYTLKNSGTHCSLIFDIFDKYCNPRIELISVISPAYVKIYNCTDGYIKIDKELWNQNIIKAEFNFNFHNTDEPERQMFWKGKIYTGIVKN